MKEKRMTRKEFLVTICFVAVLIGLIILYCANIPAHIRYIISGGDDIVIGNPEFVIEDTEAMDYDTYSLEEEIEPDLYVVDIDDNYFDNDSCTLRVASLYYNYPDTPVVKINGEQYEVSTYNTGDADSFFGEFYFAKGCTIDVTSNIKRDTPYKIYTRCKHASNTVNVVFE